MRNAILSLLILFLSVCSYGQKKNINMTTNRSLIRIDQSKPSVFLSFVGFEEDNPIYKSDTRERVRLKITNNSKWSIYLGVFEYGEENKKSLYHYVEKENDSISSIESSPGYMRGHVGSPDSELKSGASIIFTVPQNHLADNLKIRIDFEYEWERELNDSQYSNPLHSVFFHSWSIPKK